VLLDTGQIAALNVKIRALTDGPVDLLQDEPTPAGQQIAGTFAFTRRRLSEGEIVISMAAMGAAEASAATLRSVDEFRVSLAENVLWCMPMTTPILAPGGSIAFDRNRCTEVHPGELVRVLGRTADGLWWYVRARYAVGWMMHPMLTEPMTRTEARAWVFPEQCVVITRDRTLIEGARLRLGTVLPVVKRDLRPMIRVPTAGGVIDIACDGMSLARGPLPFTRRNVFDLALAQVGEDYGWGGYGGGLDCSRLLMDLFSVFGIHLPRNSRFQGLSGVETIELLNLPPERKLAALRRNASCGIILLQMPGHIMLYLGEERKTRDGSGSFVVSALSDFRERCCGGGETLVRVDKILVSNLATGASTSAGSYLSRLERLAVFGACR